MSLRCDSPGAYRAIFRQVKFLRLLHVLREGEDGAYEGNIVFFRDLIARMRGGRP